MKLHVVIFNEYSVLLYQDMSPLPCVICHIVKCQRTKQSRVGTFCTNSGYRNPLCPGGRMTCVLLRLEFKTLKPRQCAVRHHLDQTTWLKSSKQNLVSKYMDLYSVVTILLTCTKQYFYFFIIFLRLPPPPSALFALRKSRERFFFFFFSFDQ